MKINNSIIIYFLVALVFISSLGCEEFEVGNEFLAQPPELDYTKDSAFATAERAREVLWTAYDALPAYHDPPQPIFTLTDLTNFGEAWGPRNDWVFGTYNADNNAGFAPPDMWEGVRYSHLVIENIDRVPDMTQQEKEKLKGEAKMIISLLYFEMFRLYGGVPYVGKAYRPTDDTQLERLTVMQTVDTLTRLIDEAIPVLPFELEDPATWSGRFTSAGAMALKVKLLLHAASPIFNSETPFMPGSHAAVSEGLVWTGGYQRSIWEEARDVAEELISKIEASSYYGMVDTGDPEDDFRKAYFERGTGETLISIRDFFTARGGWGWSRAHWRGNNIPIHNYSIKFPMKNGMSIENPASGFNPGNPFFDRDPRLYETIKVNGSLHNGRKAELWIGGRDRKKIRDDNSFAGYKMRKFVLDRNRPNRMIMHWPFVRVPEIYLSYAEILNELNNGPTDQAFEAVNKVRARVDVGPIEDFIGKPRTEIAKEEFLDAVLNERAIELGIEGPRWFDMVRYKMEDVFTAPALAYDITLNETAEAMDDFANYFQDEVDYDEHDQYFNFEVVEIDKGVPFWQKPENFSPKWYLHAFPSTEIRKGYGLIQNPGWETAASSGG